jgi:hypothetical protein
MTFPMSVSISISKGYCCFVSVFSDAPYIYSKSEVVHCFPPVYVNCCTFEAVHSICCENVTNGRLGESWRLGVVASLRGQTLSIPAYGITPKYMEQHTVSMISSYFSIPFVTFLILFYCLVFVVCCIASD